MGGWRPGESSTPSFATCKEKNHILQLTSAISAALDSIALALVDAQLYFVLKQTINMRTNAHRTRNKILAYACLFFQNIGKFTEQED